MKLSSLLLLGTVTLSACAGLSYVQPTSGDRARVRFVTDTSGVSVLRTYQGLDCTGSEQEWMRLRRGVLLTSSVTRLGMPLWDYEEKAAKEVYVATAQPLTAIFWGTAVETSGSTRTSYQCGVPFTTTFESGKDYEVKYSWHRTACTLTVSEIVAKGQSHEFRQIASFSNRVENPNSQCLAQFKRFRLD